MLLSSVLFSNPFERNLPVQNFGCLDHHTKVMGSALPETLMSKVSHDSYHNLTETPVSNWDSGHWDIEHPLNCCAITAEHTCCPPNTWELETVVVAQIDDTNRGRFRGHQEPKPDDVNYKRVALSKKDCFDYILEDTDRAGFSTLSEVLEAMVLTQDEPALWVPRGFELVAALNWETMAKQVAWPRMQDQRQWFTHEYQAQWDKSPPSKEGKNEQPSCSRTSSSS